jgi:hypothetical protein
MGGVFFRIPASPKDRLDIMYCIIYKYRTPVSVAGLYIYLRFPRSSHNPRASHTKYPPPLTNNA